MMWQLADTDIFKTGVIESRNKICDVFQRKMVVPIFDPIDIKLTWPDRNVSDFFINFPFIFSFLIQKCQVNNLGILVVEKKWRFTQGSASSLRPDRNSD